MLAFLAACADRPGSPLPTSPVDTDDPVDAVELAAAPGPAGRGLDKLPAVPGPDGIAVDAVFADPENVKFGTLEAGSTARVSVELHNGGAKAVDVLSFDTYATGVSVGPEALGPIPPWGTRTLEVDWVPEARRLMGLASVELVDEDGNERALRLYLSGEVVGGGEVAVWADTFDDPVGVRCEEVRTLHVHNPGEAALTVGSVWIEAGGGDWLLTESGGARVATPFLVEPGMTRDLEVHFRPTRIGPIWAEVKVASDAWDDDVVSALLEGHGAADRAEVEEFTAGQPNVVTILVAVNAEAVDELTPNLEGLIQALLDTGAAWRMALLTRSTGRVAGDVPYLDPSMVVSDAVEAAEGMLASASGDNDALLEMLGAGLDENLDWVADDAPEWAGAPVHLVGINADQEQSTGSVLGYVAGYAAAAGSTHPTVVDAIAGAPPKGCDADGQMAEPSQMLYDAATATGGHFQSWCDPWADGVAALASSFVVVSPPTYALRTPADPHSIQVSIDGVPTEAGWTFDSVTNVLAFDGDAQPPGGASIHVEYMSRYDCEGD